MPGAGRGGLRRPAARRSSPALPRDRGRDPAGLAGPRDLPPAPRRAQPGARSPSTSSARCTAAPAHETPSRVRHRPDRRREPAPGETHGQATAELLQDGRRHARHPRRALPAQVEPRRAAAAVERAARRHVARRARARRSPTRSSTTRRTGSTASRSSPGMTGLWQVSGRSELGARGDDRARRRVRAHAGRCGST